MRIPSFVRVNRNKRFDYTPRYYDEVKEDLERRKGNVEWEKKKEERNKKLSETERINERERISFQYAKAQKKDFLSNIRVMILAVILGALVYFGDYLYDFITKNF